MEKPKKEKKPIVVYSEKYNKGTSVPMVTVENIIKQPGAVVELMERGKLSDDSEYIVVKIIIK